MIALLRRDPEVVVRPDDDLARMDAGVLRFLKVSVVGSNIARILQGRIDREAELVRGVGTCLGDPEVAPGGHDSPVGPRPQPGCRNSWMWWVVRLISPIIWPPRKGVPDSVNHIELLSGPTVIADSGSGVETGKLHQRVGRRVDCADLV